jgi:hypothetical protein
LRYEINLWQEIWEWVVQDDDGFEQRLQQDMEAGKLDGLIAEVLAEDEAGEAIDLETSCKPIKGQSS